MNTKTTLKWLCVTLLLGISIFCYSMLLHNNSADKNNIPNDTPPSTETPSQPANPQGETKPVVPIIYNTLPRSSTVFSDCVVQNLGGSEREVLKAVHNVGDNSYVIFDSSSNSYDIKSKNKSVCVAVLNKALDVISLLVLPSDNDEYFLASKVLPNGIMIATASENSTTIFSVDFALNHKGKTTLAKATSAYMYFSADGAYVFLSHENSVSVKKISDKLAVENEAEYVIPNTKIVDVFPTFDGFHIIVNGDSFFSILNYKSDGIFSGDSKQNGYKLESIFPKIKDGNRAYVALLKKEKSYTLVEYDKNFSKNIESTVGEYDFCNLLPCGENWLIISSDKAQTYIALFCKHLDKITQKENEKQIKAVSSHYEKSKNLTLCAHTTDNKMLILQYQNGELTVESEFSAIESYTQISASGTIFLTSAVKQDKFKNNYGNADIFAVKKT